MPGFQDRESMGIGRRRVLLSSLGLALGPAATGLVGSQDDPAKGDESSNSLKTMRRLATRVDMSGLIGGKSGPPLKLRSEPLLRFSNPIRAPGRHALGLGRTRPASRGHQGRSLCRP